MKIKILMAPEGEAAGAGSTALTGEGSTGSGQAGAQGGTGDGSPPAGAAGTGTAAPAAGTVLTQDGKAAGAADPKTTTGQEGTQGEPAKAAEAAAADIQIKVPDGVVVDQKLMDSFKAFAKEHKIGSEAAQKLADAFIARQGETMKEAQDRQLEQVTQWAEEARADKEIGGERFEANLTAGRKALQRFGSPGLVKVLNETGLGNHKDVIRFFAQVGSKISEDKLPRTGTDQGTGEAVDPTVLMYPTMQPK